MGGQLLMKVTQTQQITKSELTTLLNRPNKSIELFTGASPQLTNLINNLKRTDRVSVVVIRR